MKHGATYTCDVEFQSLKLHPTNNWVIDIGKALKIVKEALSKYNFKNLDDLFPGDVMTTTEFMSKQIFMDICALLKSEYECDNNENNFFTGKICVKLWESHNAWAKYEGEI